MDAFTYTAAPVRVVFGFGTRSALADEIRRAGCGRALLLSTPTQRERAEAYARELGALAAGVFAGAVMHTPVEVTEQAVREATAARADCVVALGGGSTIGLGNAIALRTDLFQIVMPTTYAGSEATAVVGQTEGGRKTTLRDARVQPEVIIYDVELTLTLPPAITAVSGMNAIAHAVEALYAADGNPMIATLAEEGMRAFAAALPVLVATPRDRDARAQALYGAWLCGTCLNAVSMGLHHKLCHTLGGSFGLPHAETHTVVLPHAARFNAAAAPAAMRRVAQALGVVDAPQGLYDLARRLGAPASLAELGLREADLDTAADLAVAVPYPNPAPLTRDSVRALLQEAWQGVRPAASAA